MWQEAITDLALCHGLRPLFLTLLKSWFPLPMKCHFFIQPLHPNFSLSVHLGVFPVLQSHCLNLCFPLILWFCSCAHPIHIHSYIQLEGPELQVWSGACCSLAEFGCTSTEVAEDTSWVWKSTACQIPENGIVSVA